MVTRLHVPLHVLLISRCLSRWHCIAKDLYSDYTPLSSPLPPLGYLPWLRPLWPHQPLSRGASVWCTDCDSRAQVDHLRWLQCCAAHPLCCRGSADQGTCIVHVCMYRMVLSKHPSLCKHPPPLLISYCLMGYPIRYLLRVSSLWIPSAMQCSYPELRYTVHVCVFVHMYM